MSRRLAGLGRLVAADMEKPRRGGSLATPYGMNGPARPVFRRLFVASHDFAQRVAVPDWAP